MTRVLSAFCIVVALAAPALARESAIQITRQGPALILVQKDVGGSERWAINLSLEESWPLELTGNVFRTDGGPASFLQCRPIDVLNDTAPVQQRTVVYNCYAAGTCTGAPCDANAWSFVDTVNIPMMFFLP